MKLLKKYVGYLLLGVIEIIAYFYMMPHNLEMFFMGWGLFFFALLIYNIFNVFADGSMASVGDGFAGNAGKQVLVSKLAESLYGENKNDKREGGGLLDPSNIFFLILTFINIVGYIKVMPK